MRTAYTCTLLRRLAAIVYDSIVLIGLIFLAAVPPTILYGGGISEPLPAFGMQLYLLAVAFAFFGGFWTHGGQTIGMRAWRIRVVDRDGRAITWRHALVRFLAAILSWGAVGIGFAWSLFDPERLTWHDHLSRTRTVHLVAQAKRADDGQ
jgi:uncharacterized RDD family membrane protein YckC